jgi:uncharacterized protein
VSSSSISVTAGKPSPFSSEKTICIETYRKTGEAVRTPVWFAEEDGELFVRSASRTGKVKRIRNNPKVRVAPCTFRGTLKGDWVDCQAKILGPEQSEHVFNLLKKKYGLSYRSVRLLQRVAGVFSRHKAKPLGLAIRTMS